MMWSDRLSPKQRQSFAARLRAILPAPSPAARGAKTPLRSGGKAGPSPLQVAEELREQAGFSWLDGGEEGHRLFANPRAVLSVRNGRASVSGPGGRAAFTAGGFDLLEAAFEAWGGAGAGALLAGYFGYELGSEIEPLPAPQQAPPDDMELPDLSWGSTTPRCAGTGRAGRSIRRMPGARPEIRTRSSKRRLFLPRPGNGRRSRFPPEPWPALPW